jgi:hypothetical protein
MNSRVGVWLAVIAILAISGIIVFGFDGFASGPRYSVADSYIEDNSQMNNVVFNFVNTEVQDTNLLKKISDGFKNQYLSKVKGKKQAKPVTVLVTQFYNQKDAGAVTPEAMQTMGIPPQMLAPIANKLQYVPREKGHIRVDFIKHEDLPGLNLPPANIAQMPILGPKPGFKMQELVRQLIPPSAR